MRLVGMQRQGIAVLERQLLATERLRREEHLVRRRPGRHREHHFVDQLRRLSPLPSAETRLAFRQIEVPVPLASPVRRLISGIRCTSSRMDRAGSRATKPTGSAFAAVRIASLSNET